MFEAKPVDSSTLRAAFAVMQLASPGASLAEFRRLVSIGRLVGKSGLIMALFDQRGYVHAIFRARQEQQLCKQHMLKVTEFTHGDSYSTVVLLEMVDALERFCRDLGCDQMTIEAARSEAGNALPLADVLTARGFSGESLIMARRI